MLKPLFISLLSLLLMGCATSSKYMTPASMSELQQGKRYFEEGYYKRAMHELLPLACDGVGEAQYAVGYMYYYGLGVAQDTDVGYFWIKRSAKQGCAQAIQALKVIDANDRKQPKKKLKYPSSIEEEEDAFYY
jgi:TPR repeat protein